MDFSHLKTFMDELVAWRIPGNSVSVYINNKEVFSYQAGYENVEKQIKMPPDVLFNIYSAGKPVTAVSGLQLIEKKIISLDDPVYDFIPEYKNLPIIDEQGNERKAACPVTIRSLLTMSSGINYGPGTKGFDKAMKETSGDMNTLVVARCMAENGLSFNPGEKWQYGYSLDLLVAVIEVVSGKKFRDYVKENIFDPLGMKDAFFHNEKVIDRVAEQYRYINSDEADIVNLQASSEYKTEGYLKHIDKSTMKFGKEYDSGSGGITASVSDMAKFASALANGGKGPSGEKIISAETIELMRMNHLNSALFEDFKNRWPQHKGFSYGLGVRTLIDKSLVGNIGTIGEFGWGGAAGATLHVDPAYNLAVFYAHHMLNPHEAYYQPRLREAVYKSLQ